MDIFAFVVLSFSSLLLFFFEFSDAADSISKSHFLSDTEGTTLVSKDRGFALGFFSPGNSINCYLGIWYNNIPVRTVVWVANRGNPITDSPGALMVNSSGSLVLLGQKYFRSGPWNGRFFSGMPEFQTTQDYSFTFDSNNNEVNFMFDMIQKSAITRAVLNQSQFKRYMWVEEKKEWSVTLYLPKDQCDSYDLRGANGI